MTEKELATNNMSAKSSEVPTNQQQQKVDKKLITLQGITTSQIRTREKLSDTPAYCFLKTDQQEQDIPVIFRIREQKPCPHHKKYFSDLQKEINCCPWYCNGKLGDWIKPKIKKGSYLQVEGHFTDSDKKRKSFTAYSYQLLNQEVNQQIETHDKYAK